MAKLEVLWQDISEDLKSIEVSDQAWRLAAFLVYETVRWFGKSAKDAATHRGQERIVQKDVAAVVKMIAFPLDLSSSPESKPYRDDTWVRGSLQHKFDEHNPEVITDEGKIEDAACHSLRLVAGRTLDLTFLEAKLEAEREGSTSARRIETRHVIRGCERLPYPLDWLC